MACRVEKMDFEPGGGFETLMSEDSSKLKPHVEWCFLDIVPQERIVFTTALKEGREPAEPWLTLTSIIQWRTKATAPDTSPGPFTKIHKIVGSTKTWDLMRAGAAP